MAGQALVQETQASLRAAPASPAGVHTGPPAAPSQAAQSTASMSPELNKLLTTQHQEMMATQQAQHAALQAVNQQVVTQLGNLEAMLEASQQPSALASGQRLSDHFADDLGDIVAGDFDGVLGDDWDEDAGNFGDAGPTEGTAPSAAQLDVLISRSPDYAQVYQVKPFCRLILQTTQYDNYCFQAFRRQYTFREELEHDTSNFAAFVTTSEHAAAHCLQFCDQRTRCPENAHALTMGMNEACDILNLHAGRIGDMLCEPPKNGGLDREPSALLLFMPCLLIMFAFRCCCRSTV